MRHRGESQPTSDCADVLPDAAGACSAATTRRTTCATRCLPRDVRPGRARALRLRPRRGRDRRRRRRPPAGAARRAALDAWEAELDRGLGDGRSDHPVIARARRRRARATGCRSHLLGRYMALDARRLRRAGADREPRTSSTATWTAAGDGRAGSWRRCSARRPGQHGDFARLGVAFQLTNFIRDVREDWRARPGLPARPAASDDARATRTATRRGCASASRTRSRRARALFAETPPRSPARCAGPCGPGSAVARGVYVARARPRRAQRLRRARRAAPRCALGGVPGGRRRRSRAMTVRATRARRGAHAARRRRAPTCSSAARASPGSRSRASSPAAAPTCSSSTATRSASARRRPARRRRRGCTRWASSGSIRQELPCMAFHTPHGSARFRLPWSWSAFDYRELCARAVGAVRRRALRDREGRRPRAGRRRRDVVHTDRGDLTRAARRRRARLAPRARRARTPAARGAALAAASRSTRHDGERRRDLDVWIERGARPPRLRLARARPAARRASASAPTSRATARQGADRDARRSASASTPSRYQGNWFPHRLRAGGRGRRLLRRRQRRPLLPALGRGHPHRVLLRHRRGPRAARGARRASRTRERALRALRRVPRRATGARSARALALQRADPGAAAARADASLLRAHRPPAPDRPRVRLVPGPGASAPTPRALADTNPAAADGDRLRRARPRARSSSRTGARARC